jgi:hypothetical protein
LKITPERLQDGLNRLVAAPRDLSRWDHAFVDPGPRAASPEHQQLFHTYRREIAAAATQAIREWDAEIDWLTQHEAKPEQAIRERWMSTPAGPAARPFFVALIRKFWLTCDALNARVPTQRAVPPEAFMVTWLRETLPAGADALRVLACVPYWPLGMDEDGHWL